MDEDEVEYLQTLATKQYKADLEKEKEVAELVREATISFLFQVLCSYNFSAISLTHSIRSGKQIGLYPHHKRYN